MADKTPFSTGKIRVAAYGTTLDDTYNLINITDVTFSVEFQEALIRGCALLNEFPTADIQFDAEVSMQFSTTSIPLALIPLVTGATLSSGGGYDTYTPSLTSRPAALTAQFITTDPTTGKNIIITIPRGKCKSMPLNFTRADYGKSQYTISSRPGSGDAPFTIAFQQ